MQSPFHVVFVNHGGEHSYLFEVPTNELITRGDRLIVDTIRGESPAVAQSGSIFMSAEQLDQVVYGVGAYLPLKKVLGKQIQVTRIETQRFPGCGVKE